MIFTDPIKSEKSTVVFSLFWKFLERGSTQGIQFIIQLFLARLLNPQDYGLIAIVLVFISIANVFVQSGFNTALIQKKDSDQLDFSTVFYISFLNALILYLLIFFIAPLISLFFSNSTLIPLLRVLSINLFFAAINSVQYAMVAKKMQFKIFFFSSLGSVLGSGVIGLYLAFSGFGVWALVYQQLASNFLVSVILWHTVKWRPLWEFSFNRAKPLFSYGSKLLAASLIETAYQNIYSLVIGRFFSSKDLGLFSRGEQFPQIIESNVNGSIQTVLLPTLSQHNDNFQIVSKMIRRSISLTSFLIIPLLFGLAAIADSLVTVILTDKWIECVPYLRLSCFAFVFYPIHSANLTAINSLGRSDIYFKLEIVKKIIGVIILILSIPFGLIGMSLGRVMVSVICTLINAYPNKKLLNYGFIDQIGDIIPSLSIGFIMFIIVYLVSFTNLSALVTIVIQISLGFVIYVLLAIFTKNEAFCYLKNMF